MAPLKDNVKARLTRGLQWTANAIVVLLPGASWQKVSRVLSPSSMAKDNLRGHYHRSDEQYPNAPRVSSCLNLSHLVVHTVTLVLVTTFGERLSGVGRG